MVAVSERINYTLEQAKCKKMPAVSERIAHKNMPNIRIACSKRAKCTFEHAECKKMRAISERIAHKGMPNVGKCMQ